MSDSIYHTKDYSKFELHAFNRLEHNIKPLVESMKKHGFLRAYPLHVSRGESGKLIIKAGHHRFLAAQRLGIPVLYVVQDDDASVYELEKASRPWSTRDYLASYCGCGNEEYDELRLFHEETGIDIGSCIGLLGNGNALSTDGKAYRSGQFKVRTREFADQIAALVFTAKRAKFPYATHQLFVKALSKACLAPEVDPAILQAAIKRHSELLTKCAHTDDYLALLEDVYNRRRNPKLPLAFLAKKATAKRHRAGA